MQDTVAKLRADNMTISGPNSLVKTARARMALNGGPPVANGKVKLDNDGGFYL